MTIKIPNFRQDLIIVKTDYIIQMLIEIKELLEIRKNESLNKIKSK